jgi:cell division topological specificity factor
MWNRIIEFLNKELVVNPNYKDSRNDAKTRLKMVLMHDRSQLSPLTMNKMKEEILEVISRYVKVNKDSLELKFQKDSNTIALTANIPVVEAKNSLTAT